MDSSINSIINTNVSVNERSVNEPNSKIIKIPKSLENNQQSQKLRADVVRHNNDGTLDLRTDDGTITIRPKNLRLKIENGDKIELLINKGNPPTSAVISLPPKTNNVIPEVEINNLNINLPPQLTVQEILNGVLIKVEPINSQNITQTYIENINSNLNLVSNFPIVVENSLSLENPLITNTGGEVIPKLELLELPVISGEITDFTILKIPTTQIPLSIIMAKIIANPNIESIALDKISLDTPTPSVFSAININEINPSFNENNIRAGEIIVELAGFTMDKHLPVIKTTENQNYALQIQIENIQIGSQLKINISDIIQLNQNVIIAPSSNIALLTPEIWGVMQDIQNALNISNPQVGISFNNIIPNPAKPTQMATSTLFFIAAMRSGDLQSWLGERAIDILKRSGKTDLLTKLGKEMSNISRVSFESNTQEWRNITLPLAWQDEIHKAVIHYRKEGNENDTNQENTGEKTRFVMDLNLSKIGKTQIDGLFISNKDDKGKLDLILRTENCFSSTIKQEMKIIYKNALNSSDFTGDISFQGNIDRWVNITPDAKSKFSEEI